LLSSDYDFENVIEIFNTTKLIAPVYYIVSGTKPGEGAIITRDRNDGNVRRIGDAKQGDGSWYVCETNYDWWQPVMKEESKRERERERERKREREREERID